MGTDEPRKQPSQEGHRPSLGHGPKTRPVDASAEPIGTKSKHRATVGKWRECDRPLLGRGAPPDEGYQPALTLRTSPDRTDHNVALKV